MFYHKNKIYINTVLCSCLTISPTYLFALDLELANGSNQTNISSASGDSVTVAQTVQGTPGRVTVKNQKAIPGSNQIGVVELTGGSVNLGSGSRVQVTGWGGSSSAGVSLNSGTGSRFTADNLEIENISTSSDSSDNVYGINASATGTNSTIDLTGASIITLDVDDSSATNSRIIRGIDLSSNGTTLSAETLNIDITYNNTVVPPAPTPMSRQSIDGVSVLGSGQSLTYNDANITVTNNTANTESTGIISGGTSITGADTNITINGGGSGQILTGIDAGLGDGSATSMAVSGATMINVMSGGVDSTLTGISSTYSQAQFSQQSGNLTINLDSAGNTNNIVNGLYSESAASSVNNIDINTTDFTVTNVDNVATDSHFVYADGGNINITTGTLNFTDSSNSITDIIKASDNGNVVINAQSSSLVGKIVSEGTGSIDFTSVAGTFSGSTIKDSTGVVKFNLGSGFVWNMNDDSTLSNLSLDNSTVNFTKTSGGNPAYETLTTDTLQSAAGSSNTFRMRTDVVGGQGDLINVTGNATGDYKLAIANNGANSTDGSETLTVVKTGTNNANFTLANKVEQGAYEYSLRSVASSPQDLELYTTASSGGGDKTSTAEAASSFLNIGYLTNYIDNQTLLQRLGDLRNSEAAGVKSNGLWIREFGGKLSAFSGSGLSGFDMTYTGTQLGIDKHIDVSNGNLLVGAMAGYTRTNPNYRRGDGTGKNYTAGLYATYYQDSGLYVDSVLKYNSMRNHFNVEDTAGNTVKGTGKTQGIMASVEVGKRFWTSANKQGLYLEPQAQLSYGYQNGDSVHSSNGLRVGLSHYNSTLGRASIIAGYQTQGENPVNIYLKTGVVREMSGGASYRFNDGSKNNHTFRSSWFDNGIGANVNINKKHNIYAEADYSTGGKFDNAMLNVGYRYSF